MYLKSKLSMSDETITQIFTNPNEFVLHLSTHSRFEIGLFFAFFRLNLGESSVMVNFEHFLGGNLVVSLIWLES